jgi:hypothetical protein
VSPPPSYPFTNHCFISFIENISSPEYWSVLCPKTTFFQETGFEVKGSTVFEIIIVIVIIINQLCGLVVRVPGYRSRGPDSILGAPRFSVK